MKNQLLLIALIVIKLTSCSNSSQVKVQSSNSVENDIIVEGDIKSEVEEPKRRFLTPDTQQIEIFKSIYEIDLSTIVRDYEHLPFGFENNDEWFFISVKGPFDLSMETLDGRVKFGLIDSDLNELLTEEFDAISNPNIILQDCLELRKNNKYTLYSLGSKEMANDWYNLILPDSLNNCAYALNDQNTWFKITIDSSQFNVQEYEPNISSYFEKFSWNLNDWKKYCFIDLRSYYKENGKMFNDGWGTIMMPSLVRHFQFSKDANYMVHLENTEAPFDYFAGIKDSTSWKIGNVKASILKLYSQSFDAREYTTNSYGISTIIDNRIKTKKLVEYNNSDDITYFCFKSKIRKITDSLIETTVTRSNSMFFREPVYQYFSISSKGKIQELKTYRHFAFTKFIQIDESYFKGCYSINVDSAEKAQNPNLKGNIWLYDHLTIEHLDIMRNEIFASYGYKFKTEKWQTYFQQFDWYEPLHDNVDHKLTNIDKHNIQVILETKEKLSKNESRYTNKRNSNFYPAG